MLLYVPPSVNTVLFINYNSYYFDMTHVTHFFLISLQQSCQFMKNYTQTALHVYFAGNLRIFNCDDCCSRWYFTFNGVSVALLVELMARTIWQQQLAKTFTVTVTLKDTAITFTREKCEWDSGLETAIMVINLLTRTQGGPQCPGSSLKKWREHNSKLD